MGYHTGTRASYGSIPIILYRGFRPLVRKLSDYHWSGRIYAALLLFSLVLMFPLVIIPSQTYNSVMSDGITKTAMITESQWETVKGKNSTSYTDHVVFTFNADGTIMTGKAKRNVYSVDQQWLPGSTVPVKYLSPSAYDLVGDESHKDNQIVLILLSSLVTFFLYSALTPLFYVKPVDEHEKRMLKQNVFSNEDGTPIQSRRFGLRPGDNYTSVQKRLRGQRGSLQVTLISLSAMFTIGFFVCAVVSVFSLDRSFGYPFGAVVCGAAAPTLFWLEGVYLRRGKWRGDYAYVQEVHDRVRRYRNGSSR